VTESLTDSLAVNSDPWGTRASSASQAVVAEWWTSGQNAFMEGALAALKERYQPLYAGAT
jgi:hypothetical protein